MLNFTHTGESPWIIAVLLGATVIFNSGKIVDTYLSHRKSRLRNINEALEQSYLPDIMRTQLRLLAEDEYYRLITGYEIPKKRREELIHLWTQSRYAFRLQSALSSEKHLMIDDDRVSVHISLFDKFTFYWNFLVCFLLIIVFSLTVTSAVLTLNESIPDSAIKFLLSGVALGMGCFFLSENAAILRARRIVEIMASLKSNSFKDTFIHQEESDLNTINQSKTKEIIREPL